MLSSLKGTAKTKLGKIPGYIKFNRTSRPKRKRGFEWKQLARLHSHGSVFPHDYSECEQLFIIISLKNKFVTFFNPTFSLWVMVGNNQHGYFSVTSSSPCSDIQ